MSDSQTLAQDSIETLNNNITSNPYSDPSLQSSQSTASDQPEKNGEESSKQPEEKEEEEEEEGECGFCLYMKGGDCKEQFINWEKCIYEAEELNVDVVEKCIEVTKLLKRCMEANTDYYGPILSAEKSSEEADLNELENAKMHSDQNEIPIVGADKSANEEALNELEKEKMHSDQNEIPIVGADKSANEEALNELEKEKMHSDQNEVKHSTG